MGVSGVGVGPTNSYYMQPQGVQSSKDMATTATGQGPQASMPPPMPPDGVSGASGVSGADTMALEQKLGQYSKAQGTWAAGAVKAMFDLPYADQKFSNLKGMPPDQAAQQISQATGVEPDIVKGLISLAASAPNDHSMNNPMEQLMTHLETQGAWAGK